jgi:hypothetical protein
MSRISHYGWATLIVAPVGHEPYLGSLGEERVGLLSTY